MALVGLHVIQGFAGGSGANASIQSLISNPQWSETLATAGTTTNAAVAGSGTGRPIFRVRSSEDSFVAVGPTPDAIDGTRYFVPANTDYDFFANPGDKVAWIVALS